MTSVPVFSVFRDCHAVADVLAPELHRVTAAKPGVEQHVEPHPLARPDRPAPSKASTSSSVHGRQAVHPCAAEFLTPSVGSTAMWSASSAQRNSPRIASRKLRACAGVAERRSRLAMMDDLAILMHRRIAGVLHGLSEMPVAVVAALPAIATSRRIVSR